MSTPHAPAHAPADPHAAPADPHAPAATAAAHGAPAAHVDPHAPAAGAHATPAAAHGAPGAHAAPHAPAPHAPLAAPAVVRAAGSPRLPGAHPAPAGGGISNTRLITTVAVAALLAAGAGVGGTYLMNRKNDPAQIHDPETLAKARQLKEEAERAEITEVEERRPAPKKREESRAKNEDENEDVDLEPAQTIDITYGYNGDWNNRPEVFLVGKYEAVAVETLYWEVDNKKGSGALFTIMRKGVPYKYSIDFVTQKRVSKDVDQWTAKARRIR